MNTTKTQTESKQGFQADFKPPIEKRQIRFASMEDVLKLTPKINKQFKVAFDILAK